MDARIIIPIPAKGIMALNDPAAWQGVIYTDGSGKAVVDYMTSIAGAHAKDADALTKVTDSGQALMVSAYDADQAKMVYLKPPPAGYVFGHEYAGTAVVPDSAAPVTPLEQPLSPDETQPTK